MKQKHSGCRYRLAEWRFSMLNGLAILLAKPFLKGCNAVAAYEYISHLQAFGVYYFFPAVQQDHYIVLNPRMYGNQRYFSETGLVFS